MAGIYRWCTVGGADPEPCELAREDGKRVAYTCGCADPFFLDDPDCPLRLVETPQWYRSMPPVVLDPLDPPDLPRHQGGKLGRVPTDRRMPKEPERGHGWRGSKR